MNLRQIEVFHAVFTTGGTSRAAELLRISQPAVSKAVIELERGTGLRLFDRSTGRMVPTAEAHLFFKEVEASFVGLSRLRGAAARIRDFGSGELRLASLSALSTNVMPRAIRAFQTRHPDVAITFQTHLSSVIRDMVAAGRFDVGVVADEVDATGVNVRPFTTYRAAIALPKGHRLVSRAFICPQDLDGEPFIALAQEDTTRQHLDRLLREAGASPRVVLETPFSTTVCAMVEAGLGVGLVNPINAWPFLPMGLVVRPFEPVIEFRALLITPPQARPSRIVEDCIDCLFRFRDAHPASGCPSSGSPAA